MIVEIPQHSANKYEYDGNLGVFRLDRALYSPLHYPGDYGFIPGTLADDNDPLDCLVLVQQPSYPGVMIEVRPVGVLNMLDSKEHDQKILAVPTPQSALRPDPHHGSDLPPRAAGDRALLLHLQGTRKQGHLHGRLGRPSRSAKSNYRLPEPLSRSALEGRCPRHGSGKRLVRAEKRLNPPGFGGIPHAGNSAQFPLQWPKAAGTGTGADRLPSANLVRAQRTMKLTYTYEVLGSVYLAPPEIRCCTPSHRTFATRCAR